jgi:UDP-N-acetylglucosamine 3-dehydrogenase
MITLGIAGLGYIGRIHLEASQKVADVRVAAIGSLRSEEIREAQRDLTVYSTYSELVSDSRLDAVVICLPTFLHEQYVIEALEKGRHVLCEKPMALDAEAAGRMVDAAKRNGRILMVAQVLRFWPQYVRIRELVCAGAVGNVRSLSLSRLGRFPAWGTWFRDPAKSGGCLLDLQVHDVDFVHWLLATPEYVHTRGIRSASGSFDHVCNTLTYPSAVVTIESSYLMPDSWPFTSSIRVLGTDGCLEYIFRVGANIQEREQASHEFRLYHANGQASEPTVAAQDPFAEQLSYFAECVRQGREPTICRAAESWDVMKVMTASQESAEKGRQVALAG